MSSLRPALTLSVRQVLSRMRCANVASHIRTLSLRSCQTPISILLPRVRVSGIDNRVAVTVASRQIHTAGDKELVEFLKDEIHMEKQTQKTSGKLPKIKGFEIVSTDGPNVTLKKTLENESVTIKFNINNSVDDSVLGMETEPQQEQQTPDAKMISKPSFSVEINKGGSKTLAIQCVFPPADEYPPSAEREQGEAYEDLIEIQDVALLNKSQEWNDDVYSLSASVMDGNLYDMLMKMLEERGVDADFVDQLIEFSTSYVHLKYVDILENLKDFVDSK